MIRRGVTGALLAASVALAALASVPAPAIGDSSIAVPASIDATGGRDVTRELNALFAHLTPGTTVTFPAHGRYRTEGVVQLAGRHDVTLAGHGATLFASTDGRTTAPPARSFASHWPRMRAHLDIRDSTGITVRGLAIVGPNRRGTYRPALEAQAGFVIARSQHVTLDHVTARDTYGDGVYVVGLARDVTVRSCTLDHNGRQGVAVVGGEQVVVEGCSIRATGRSAIDLEPSHGTVRTVHIRDNRVQGYHNFLLAAVGAGPGVEDVWLEHNHVRGARGVSLYVGSPRSVRHGIHVIGNSGDGTSAGYEGALMRFTRFDGIEVRANRQRVARGVTPVQLVSSCHAVATRNRFPGAGRVLRRDGDCADPIPVPRTTRPRRPAGRVVAQQLRNATG